MRAFSDGVRLAQPASDCANRTPSEKGSPCAAHHPTRSSSRSSAPVRYLRSMPRYVDHAAELRILDQLAQQRWGPTGFLCPHCRHPHAVRLRSRPRVRQCRKCRRQTSITAGTLLHGTRLPLAAWAERGGDLQHRPARVPSSSALAWDFAISRSSAWHLNQRIFLCAELGSAAPVGTTWLTYRLRVRRPKRGSCFPAAAPARVRALHEAHRDGYVRPLEVDIAFSVTDDTLRLARIAPSMDELREFREGLPNLQQIHQHHGFGRYLRAGVVLGPRTVSLRWLPRWSWATLAGWNTRGDLHPPPWFTTAIRCGRRPLRALDPWLA